MSRPGALTESVTSGRRRPLLLMATFAAAAFAFSVGLGAAPDAALWNAIGPVITAATCVALLMSTRPAKWWLPIAALYLQVVRLCGDVSLPMALTFGLDISWFGALYAAFHGRRALAAGAVVACAGLLVSATLLRH